MFRCMSSNNPKAIVYISLANIVSTFIPTVLTPLILEYAKVVQETIHITKMGDRVRLTHPDFDYFVDIRCSEIMQPADYTGNDTHLYIIDTCDIGCNPVYSQVIQVDLTRNAIPHGNRTLSHNDIQRISQLAKGQALAMFHGEVYLIGGTRYWRHYPYTTRTVLKLTQELTLVHIPRLCRRRTFAAAVTVNNRIYCIGGTAKSRKTGMSMEAYDGVKWRLLKSKMHFSHQYHTAVAYDTYIIVTGGYIFAGNELVESRHTEVYNVITNRWELKPSLIPQGLRHKLFLFNDQVMLTDWSSRWWTYNVVEDTWSDYDTSGETRYPWPIIS